MQIASSQLCESEQLLQNFLLSNDEVFIAMTTNDELLDAWIMLYDLKKAEKLGTESIDFLKSVSRLQKLGIPKKK